MENKGMNEKKVYVIPEMTVVEYAYQSDVLLDDSGDITEEDD